MRSSRDELRNIGTKIPSNETNGNLDVSRRYHRREFYVNAIEKKSFVGLITEFARRAANRINIVADEKRVRTYSSVKSILISRTSVWFLLPSRPRASDAREKFSRRRSFQLFFAAVR